MKTESVNLSEKFGIDAAERALRMSYIDLTARDVALLRELLPLMERNVDRIVTGFYEHLLKHKEARAFFPDKAMLDHVKETQREYLLDLCRGEFDDNYFERRLQIGVVHERIGLVPKWYIGSYSNFTGLILPLILRRYWWNPKKGAASIMALMKIMNLDQQLVMDTYIGSVVAKLQDLGERVQDAVGVVASSAEEISASTSQFAASAAQTSVSVVETTTTMEEVRQTAEVAAGKARDVADSATKAFDDSASGQGAATESVEGMKRIKKQMESIADSMVKLSEQSRAIGQIIATVDDLAQQSKLLAFNASIEAAKAGEHGKGFAVVAQEVKALAEQSRQATSEVRGILNDIQKATSTAVMVTEQGSHAVEDGMSQAAHAGDAIEALAGSVGNAAEAATQIAASSQQQLVGVDQVADAMKEIKGASTQNVESARQLERAAQRLQDLGHKLKDLIEEFVS